MNPVLFNYGSAVVIALVFLVYCFFIYRSFRKPMSKTAGPVQRCIEALVVALPAATIVWWLVSVPIFLSYLQSPVYWPMLPQAITLFVVGLLLLVLSPILALKGRANHALLCLMMVCAGIMLLSRAQRIDVKIDRSAPTVLSINSKQFGLESIENIRLVVNGIDLGSGEVLIDQARFDQIKSAITDPANKGRKFAHAVDLRLTSPQSTPGDKATEFLSAKLQVVVDGTPLAGCGLGPASLSQFARRETVFVDPTELQRQFLALFAWSRLHEAGSGRLPAWWDMKGVDHKVLWQAAVGMEKYNHDLKPVNIRLAEHFLADGKPITSDNAIAVLNRLVSTKTFDNKLRDQTLDLVVSAVSDSDLAAWVLSNLSPYETNPERYLTLNDTLAKWIGLHRADLERIGRMGDLLAGDLLRTRRAEFAFLLGGPLMDDSSHKLHLSYDETSQRYRPGNWFPRGYTRFNRFGPFSHLDYSLSAIYLFLPGEVGDIYRMREASRYPGVFGQYGDVFTSLAFAGSSPQEFPAAEQMILNAFEPVAPASRDYLNKVWDQLEKRYQSSGQQWPARGRNASFLNETPVPSVEWWFLSAVLKETASARYIDVAKKSVSPRFEQSPEDFVEEVGLFFDQNVLLPTEARNIIWADLVASIVKTPRAFGLTQPPDPAKVRMDRPALSKGELVAQRAIVTDPNASISQRIRGFLLLGLPPGYPQILAKRSNPSDRIAAVLTAIRCPSPENIKTLEALTHDPDTSVASHAKAGERFIVYLRDLPADKLPAPFTKEAMNFFDLSRFEQKGE